MAEQEKAVDETADKNDKEAVNNPDQQAFDDATEDVGTLRTRLKDLSDRLASEGRSKAQIKAQVATLQSQLDSALSEQSEAKARAEKWEEFYFTKLAPEHEREQYDRTKKAQEQVSVQRSATEAELWKTIAQEEDPAVKVALIRAAQEAEGDLTPRTIKAIRNAVTAARKGDDGKDSKTQDEGEKVPPIRGHTSSGTGKPTFEQQLEAIQNDKNLSRGQKVQEMLALKSQIAARDRALNRG